MSQYLCDVFDARALAAKAPRMSRGHLFGLFEIRETPYISGADAVRRAQETVYKFREFFITAARSYLRDCGIRGSVSPAKEVHDGQFSFDLDAADNPLDRRLTQEGKQCLVKGALTHALGLAVQRGGFSGDNLSVFGQALLVEAYDFRARGESDAAANILKGEVPLYERGMNVDFMLAIKIHGGGGHFAHPGAAKFFGNWPSAVTGVQNGGFSQTVPVNGKH